MIKVRVTWFSLVGGKKKNVVEFLVHLVIFVFDFSSNYDQEAVIGIK